MTVTESSARADAPQDDLARMKNWGFGLLLLGFGLLAFQQFAPGIVLLAVGAIALIASRLRREDKPEEPPTPPPSKPRKRLPKPPSPETKPESKPKIEPARRPTPAPATKATPKPTPRPKPKPKPERKLATTESKPSAPTLGIEPPSVLPVQPDDELVPTIVTRTGINDTGTRLRDPYKDGDKVWTTEEDREILEEFAKGNGLVYVSRASVQDMQQVAIRLTRLLLNPQGDLRDDSTAHQHGRAYLPGEKNQIVAEFLNGATIDELARNHERTLLAIGWQILDHPDRPPSLRDAVAARLNR